MATTCLPLYQCNDDCDNHEDHENCDDYDDENVMKSIPPLLCTSRLKLENVPIQINSE